MNNHKLTPLSHTEIEQFCTALSTWHWHNNYEQFCQLLDFLPESNYAQEKWQTWKSLISLFNRPLAKVKSKINFHKEIINSCTHYSLLITYYSTSARSLINFLLKLFIKLLTIINNINYEYFTMCS
jgi:hypothetical protein